MIYFLIIYFYILYMYNAKFLSEMWHCVCIICIPPEPEREEMQSRPCQNTIMESIKPHRQ